MSTWLIRMLATTNAIERANVPSRLEFPIPTKSHPIPFLVLMTPVVQFVVATETLSRCCAYCCVPIVDQLKVDYPPIAPFSVSILVLVSAAVLFYAVVVT